MTSSHRSFRLLALLAMLTAGGAHAEVRIMMRPAPNSPASAAPRVEQSAPAAPSRSGSGITLRPSDADAPFSETAALGGAPAMSDSEHASNPSPIEAGGAASVTPTAVATSPGAASERPKADASAPDRRASPGGAGAAANAPPTPVTVSTLRRRKESPGEFRDRCATDGGLMQGGGKYGLCVIR